MVSHKAARLALGSLTAAASLLVPAGAGATAPAGPNGDLVFTSGRAPQNDDQKARIWVVGPFGGTAEQMTFSPPAPATQHRQPNWSPDHTKFVYAVSPSGEIRVNDLVAGTDTTFVSAVAGQDRPTWSPDGTSIAYGSGGKIFVKPYPSGSAVAVTNGTSDERPVWSPDGNTIYYNHTVGAAFDIVKRSPVTLAGTETPMVTGATNDWQPAVSPDGTQLCFTRGPKSAAAELRTASAITPDQVSATAFASAPALNCVWSPDGTEIAYSDGAFDKGDLVAKNSNGTGSPRLISQDAVASVRFDGNADWAVNFRPVCQNKTLSVALNGFVTVGLGCTDQDDDSGNLSRDIVTGPAHGNIGGISPNDTVTYTPNANFSGQDKFTFKATDGNSDSAPATITLNVQKATAAGGGAAAGKDVTAAKIDGVSANPSTWRLGPGLPVVLSRAPVGTTISYRLSEKARATLTFARKAKGRKVGRSCRKPTRKNRTRRGCTRYVKAGTLQFDPKAGTNRVKFAGRLSRGKRLKVGRYRLVVGAKDGAGNVSKNASPVFFKIVKR